MKMLKLLNAGFGDPLGDAHVQIAELGFGGVRTDVKLDIENIKTIIDEQEKYNATSIILFNGGHMDWSPEETVDAVTAAARYIKDRNYFQRHNIFFEIGNEPDIARDFYKNDPEKTNDMFWECYQAVKLIRSDIGMITPGVSNLNERGFDYLEEFLDHSIPAGAIVGFHRYPAGKDYTTPHKGFDSRKEEMDELVGLARDNKIFCTEAGMTQGPHYTKRNFPLCFLKKKEYVRPQYQYEAYKADQQINEAYDSVGLVWYQYNDGPNKNNDQDNFGVRYVDGTVKEPWR